MQPTKIVTLRLFDNCYVGKQQPPTKPTLADINNMWGHCIPRSSSNCTLGEYNYVVLPEYNAYTTRPKSPWIEYTIWQGHGEDRRKITVNRVSVVDLALRNSVVMGSYFRREW